MLQSQNLSFSYNAEEQFLFPDINSTGKEPLLILGPSGCGKSTLLHLIAGLIRPSAGSINIGGTDICKLSSGNLDKFRGEKIGIIFQRTHFISALNVWDNLKLPTYLAKKPFDAKKAESILSKLNIGHKKKSKANELSQGEQQRLAIARSIINEPYLILADEPTSSLDDANCMEVIDLLQEQARNYQAKLLIVTHDSRLKEVFDERILLEGKLNKPKSNLKSA